MTLQDRTESIKRKLDIKKIMTYRWTIKLKGIRSMIVSSPINDAAEKQLGRFPSINTAKVKLKRKNKPICLHSCRKMHPAHIMSLHNGSLSGDVARVEVFLGTSQEYGLVKYDRRLSNK
jgi:hypothetical protein